MRCFLLRRQDGRHSRRCCSKPEARVHGDVLYLGNHHESFGDQLTLKTITMHTYAYDKMHASYFIGTDDDIFWRIPDLFRAFRVMPLRGVMRGRMFKGRPVRTEGVWGKRYHVPDERYPGRVHPPFPSGTGVLMSWDVLGIIVRRYRERRQHPVDDVNVGIQTIGVTGGALTLRNDPRFLSNSVHDVFLSVQMSDGDVRADGASRVPGGADEWQRLFRGLNSGISLYSDRASPLASMSYRWLLAEEERRMQDGTENAMQLECGTVSLLVTSPRQGEVIILESIHFKYSS